MSEVTVKELDTIVEKLAALEVTKEAAAARVTELNKEIAQLEGKIVQYLNDLGRKDYDSPHGKLKIAAKWRVNLPETDLDKKQLFDHLRERGIFDKFATVNSNSLNALYMRDWEEAKERGEGMTFSMPGIGAPKLFEALNFKPKKPGG